jgi:hypothetical protein
LHNQAEAYGCLPSEILDLETPWGAWQLNEITLMVGRRVENNLNKGKDAFDGLGDQRLAVSGQPKKYRSAKNKVTKRIKIPENGIWRSN